MKTSVISMLLDIGRWKSGASPRGLDFYRESLHAFRAAGVNPLVHGNTAEADIPFSFSDLVSLIGPRRFDAIELVRCVTHGSGIQGESSWYAAITHAKMFLMEWTFSEDPSIEAVVWLDAGLARHGLVPPEALACLSVPEGFHVARSHSGSGWHVPGIEDTNPFPGRHVCGGLFGARRESFARFHSEYVATLDGWLAKGVAPLEEDLFTLMIEKAGVVVHEGFGGLTSAMTP